MLEACSKQKKPWKQICVWERRRDEVRLLEKNKWVRDSAIFQRCRVFRLVDSALSSPFCRSPIPVVTGFVSSSIPLFSCSLVPSYIHPWTQQWYPAYPTKASSADAYALMFLCLCVAPNECPPQTYMELANLAGQTFLNKITNSIRIQTKREERNNKIVLSENCFLPPWKKVSLKKCTTNI